MEKEENSSPEEEVQSYEEEPIETGASPVVKNDETIVEPVTGSEEQEQQINKSETRNLLIIGAVILGIFLLSFGGVAFYNNITGGAVLDVDGLHLKNLEGKLDEEEGYVYNGYSFVKVDGLWWTELDKWGTLLKVPLHFGPKELEDIELEGFIDGSFNQGDELFIAIDPTTANKYYTLAISELSLNVAKGMDRIPVGSCTQEDPICENRTIVSCENADGRPTIELALEGDTPQVQLSGSCIKISGQGYDIVRAVDRFLYQWYGIMQ